MGRFWPSPPPEVAAAFLVQVQGVPLEIVEAYLFQSALVGGRQHDPGRRAGFQGLLPAPGA